jgi:phage-related minor tail protein
MPEETTQNSVASADHDLLIRLDTKFDNLSDKFDSLADNVVARVESLEKWRASQEGRSKGFSSLWLIVFNILTAIVAITALILKFVR